MNPNVNIRPVQTSEKGRWLEMRHALWPRYPLTQLQDEIAKFGSALREVALIAVLDDRIVGFAEVSIRPFADGCVSGPVGYLEGWYVEGDYRRRGIGTELVKAAEEWARSCGCQEMASDCVSDNHISHQAHLALGYRSTQHCIRFRRTLVEAYKPAVDFTGIVPYELFTDSLIQLVTDPKAGGIDVFLGTTRAETTGGKKLIALEYEAFHAMADQQLRDLAKRAREQWPIIKLAIIHRVGTVPLGEPSVIIAVSTPHRAEAFDACRWIIDTLKKELAIWKKEVWDDGTGSWSGTNSIPS